MTGTQLLAAAAQALQAGRNPLSRRFAAEHHLTDLQMLALAQTVGRALQLYQLSFEAPEVACAAISLAHSPVTTASA